MESIASFAESLVLEDIANIKEGKQLPPSQNQTGLAPAGVDISQTVVPDTFMKQILGEKYTPQEAPPVEAIPELVWTEPEEDKPKSPEHLTESTAKQLVPLLEEVKSLLQEMSVAMTTTGSIGTNLAGPEKKPKTKSEILKASIRKKLKK